MRVIAWSPHLTRERAEAAGVEFVESKEQLFRQSDIVSLHMVLDPATAGMIGASDFAVMKPTAFFINTSRGPLVDEGALVDALQKRKIAGAGLDVFDSEPLPLDHPLRKLDNVTLTPHTGYVSDDNYQVTCFNYRLTRKSLHIANRYSGEIRSTTSPPSWKESRNGLLNNSVVDVLYPHSLDVYVNRNVRPNEYKQLLHNSAVIFLDHAHPAFRSRRVPSPLRMLCPSVL